MRFLGRGRRAARVGESAQLAHAVQLVKLGLAERLLFDIQARTRADAAWAMQLAGAVVTALFAEQPVGAGQAAFMDAHAALIAHAIDALRADAAVFALVDAAARQNVLLKVQTGAPDAAAHGARLMQARERLGLAPASALEPADRFIARAHRFWKESPQRLEASPAPAAD
jgi:hypothetical protein